MSDSHSQSRVYLVIGLACLAIAVFLNVVKSAPGDSLGLYGALVHAVAAVGFFVLDSRSHRGLVSRVVSFVLILCGISIVVELVSSIAIFHD